MEAVWLEARDHAVVHEKTRFAQHEAIAAAADLELLKRIGVHALEEHRRVGAHDLDLAEGRSIEQADAFPGRAAFARDRLVHRFAAAGKIPGPLPQAHVLEPGAVFGRPIVNGRAADGIEQVAARRAGEGAESDGRIGRPEGRQSDFRNGLGQRRRGDRERVHVRELALVGRHARGGVAFDVLDRAHALLHREAHVLGADVVLEIDERLASPVAADRRRCSRRGVSHPERAAPAIGSRGAAHRSLLLPPPHARPRRLPRARPQDRRSHCRRRPIARAARRRPA